MQNGRIQPLEIVKNIDYIYNHIAEGCKLILTLQSEMPFETTNPTYKYRGVIPKKLDQKPRHIFNKELNDLLRNWADNKSNVYFLDFNQYITGPESFNDHISHFKRDVYYKMSCDLVRIITSDSNIKIKNHNRFKVVYDAIKNRFLGHLAGIKWRIEKFKTKKYK